jgi:hypothetical protein
MQGSSRVVIFFQKQRCRRACEFYAHDGLFPVSGLFQQFGTITVLWLSMFGKTSSATSHRI